MLVRNFQFSAGSFVYIFQPDHVQICIAVGDVLPERTGMEAVVFLAYGIY